MCALLSSSLIRYQPLLDPLAADHSSSTRSLLLLGSPGLDRPLPWGWYLQDILCMTSFQGVHLAHRKCHILTRPSVGGWGMHCCPLSLPHYCPQDGLLSSEFSSQKEGITLFVHKYSRPFQALPHFHQDGSVLQPLSKHPARSEIPVPPFL